MEYLAANQERANNISYLQRRLFSLSDETFEELLNYIINSEFVIGFGVNELATTIIWSCSMRPYLIDKMMKLLTEILFLKPETKEDIIIEFYSFLGNVYVPNHFFLALIECKIIDIFFITKKYIRNFSILHIYYFFLPELEEASLTDKKLSKSMKDQRRSSYEKNEFTDEELEIEANLVKLKENNWFLLKEIRKYQRSLSDLVNSIKNDDINAFQTIVSQTNVDLNKTIKKSIFEPNLYFVGNCKIIEFAAFNGALNIFKFLIINKVEATKELPNFAVAGGNYEIIHICEQLNCKFFYSSLEENFQNDPKTFAIMFHRYEIYDYLREKERISYSNIEASLEKSILFNNFYVFCDIIKYSLTQLNKSDITYKVLTITKYNRKEIEKIKEEKTIMGKQKKFPIKYKKLSILNSINMFSFLINCEEHDTFKDLNNLDVEGESLLLKAAYNNKVLAVKYLCKFDEIDKNVKSVYNFTPLLSAVQGNAYNVVSFLMNLDNIDLKAKTILDWNILHIAANNINSSKILEMLVHKHEIKKLANDKNNSGNTPLNEAVLAGNYKAVKLLCSIEGIDINSLDENNYSPISESINICSIKIMFFLAKLKGIVLSQNDKNELERFQSFSSK